METTAVEALVRDEVRARGIDPLAEPDAVRALVDQAMAMIDPTPESGEMARRAFHSIAGFGPLQPLLDDPTVEEVWINAPGRVFVARDGASELTTLVLDRHEVRDLGERRLRVSGRRLDLSAAADGKELVCATLWDQHMTPTMKVPRKVTS